MMAENSSIEWTDHTFNPWIGCTKVSPACDNCYAETWAKRGGNGHLWKPLVQPRRSKTWRDPIRWNAKAEAEGRRHRVFCASLADVFDNQVDPAWREDLWALIHDTPHLDWLLLTKRPQNIAKMLPGTDGRWPSDYSRGVWGDGWPNVWLGTTVENQAEADRRIPHLLAVPAKVRFLSCEPLLGPVEPIGLKSHLDQRGNWRDGGGIHWVIAGGESGPGARPMHPDWARSVRDQCAAAGVPFLFKQWGEWAPPPLEADTAGALRCRAGDRAHVFPDLQQMGRVGKKAAGRLLDGVQHDGFPA